MEIEFRKSAVENMSFLATNTDPEICDLCVVCLCYASQSEVCRELIVTSGMLTKIGGKEVEKRFEEQNYDQGGEDIMTKF